jgi:hypothetical protein
MRANNLNLYRNANQAQTIGNTNPVNMSGVSDSLLSAASPASFSLLNNTKANKDSSDAAAAACRSYTDVDGLRRLIKDQSNKTYYDPRCGWRYKPSTGLYPEINQAALGTAAGPSFGEPGSPDEVAGGAQWFWNLEDAERKITSKICQNASKCKQLSMMGKYTDVCGYCKSTGAIIPVVGGAARYKNDPALGCAKKDIVTAASGTCPSNEGFLATPAGNSRQVPKEKVNEGFFQGKLTDAFKVREGFGSLDALNNCMDMPLSRDCVIKIAQNVGCSDEGTLIQSLKGSSGNYDSKLKSSSAFNSYTSFSPFTNGLLQDGSVASINTALDDFGKLMMNTQNNNKKLEYSARDLCLRAGEFDNYDFCTEMRPDTVLNKDNISCIEKIWLENGGTKQGTQKPTLDVWNGKKFLDFLITGIVTIISTESDDKNTNASALKNLMGVNSASQETRPGIDLPMDENTRGAETVWFDLTDVENPNAIPVIMRCDLMLAKDRSRPNPGEVLPYINNADELQFKYNFAFGNRSNNKAYTSAFEIRNTTQERVRFYVVTDDGFMISKNQNPFQNAGNGPDWGSWAYQGPTGYMSNRYNINLGENNTFVTKWFQGYGGAISQFWINTDATGWVPGAKSSFVYLTQEPLAPWMQYEICSRPNNGSAASVGLFEKRWNGSSAQNTNGSQKSSFDVVSGSVVYQTDPNLLKDIPGGKGYASFVGASSYWYTKSHFHFNAFKTISILVRPSANLANGGACSIFQHINGKAFGAGLYLSNQGGNYTFHYLTSTGQFNTTSTPAMNEWNLIVIQYVGDNSGVRKITFTSDRLASVQTDAGRAAFLGRLTTARSSYFSSPVIVGNPVEDSFLNSGLFLIGAWNGTTIPGYVGNFPSFTGDIAWIHGFRNYLDTDAVLKNEITQGWISRWPLPNLPGTQAIPQQTVYGNNGSVTCERYCGGVSGGPWNGELPKSWNGARCVGSPNSSAGCFSTTSPTPLICTCAATGTGWNQ